MKLTSWFPSFISMENNEVSSCATIIASCVTHLYVPNNQQQSLLKKLEHDRYQTLT